jgi:queuosine precursor transporter
MTAAQRTFAIAVAAMIAVVAGSNLAVQYPIEHWPTWAPFADEINALIARYRVGDWLTWAAFIYPITFLVVDLTNRRIGPERARWVAYTGFPLAVILSAWLATPRIAVASGTAFLTAQLLDIYVFSRLRRLPWWQAPLISTGLASIWDTAVFFTLAFAGTAVPWVTLALGNLAAKWTMALVLLLPFRALMGSRDAVAAPAR